MRLRVALRLARAETRRARGTLAFCVLAVAIGALCITAIRSVDDSVRASLAGQARQILGADPVVEGKQPLTFALADELTRTVSEVGARSATSTLFYSMLTGSDVPRGATAASDSISAKSVATEHASAKSASTRGTPLSRVRGARGYDELPAQLRALIEDAYRFHQKVSRFGGYGRRRGDNKVQNPVARQMEQLQSAFA